MKVQARTPGWLPVDEWAHKPWEEQAHKFAADFAPERAACGQVDSVAHRLGTGENVRLTHLGGDSSYASPVQREGNRQGRAIPDIHRANKQLNPIIRL
jgi:hypothetical protein